MNLHDLDAERSVLGALMLCPGELPTAMAILVGNDFHAPQHETIWDAIAQLAADGVQVDPITVADRLERDGLLRRLGGKATLADLVGVAAMPSQVAGHAKIIADLSRRRRLATAGAKLSMIGTAEGAPDVLLDHARDAVLGLADAQGWPAPDPLGVLAEPIAPYPLEVWPSPVREFIGAVATETQTPIELAAGIVLGVFSGAIGGQIEVKVRPGWVEPTNEFVVTAMASGSRKSPVLNACARPLEEVEREIQKEVKRHNQGLPKEEPPLPLPRLLAGDCTPEKLIDLMGKNQNRIIAMSDEAGVFSSLTGRAYNSEAGARLDFCLQAYSGSTIRVDRVGRDGTILYRPSLTIVATLQPFALARIIGDEEFSERGLPARVLWAKPADNVGGRDIDPPAVPDELTEAYCERVTELARWAVDLWPVRVVEFDDSARAVIISHMADLEPKLGADSRLGGPGIRSWASKLTGHVVRISAALHFAAHGPAGEKLRITGETVSRAVRLADHYLGHAEEIYRVGCAATREQTLIEALAERAKPGQPIRVRDFYRSQRRQWRDVAELRGVIESLDRLGWVRHVPDAKGGAMVILHPDAMHHLAKGGDTGDTGDTDTKPISQRTPGDTGDTGDTGAKHQVSDVAPHQNRVTRGGDTGDTGATITALPGVAIARAGAVAVTTHSMATTPEVAPDFTDVPLPLPSIPSDAAVTTVTRGGDTDFGDDPPPDLGILGAVTTVTTVTGGQSAICGDCDLPAHLHDRGELGRCAHCGVVCHRYGPGATAWCLGCTDSVDLAAG